MHITNSDRAMSGHEAYKASIEDDVVKLNEGRCVREDARAELVATISADVQRQGGLGVCEQKQ